MAAAAPLSVQSEAARRKVGIALYIVGMLIGAGLLISVSAFSIIASEQPGLEINAMLKGAFFALPMLVVYLWIPWIVDRYDPEPVWALVMVLGWGAIAAAGISVAGNTSVKMLMTVLGGERLGDILTACVSAPLVEELTKGMGVFFMFYFIRREFDGVVDGVVYASFAALGFAAVENIFYYSGAEQADLSMSAHSIFANTFVLRGLLSPWVHPLFTSMTGLGFGISRETNHRVLKWLAPLCGYLFAIVLHGTWNLASTVSSTLVFLMLPLWLFFVLNFGVLLLWLVRRKGKIIHQYLLDEVMMGTMTPWEATLVASPVSSLRATLEYGGKLGRQFVSVAARLALSKWHTGRANRGFKLTLSAGMILPLRQEMRRLRREIGNKIGRQLQEPKADTPGVLPSNDKNP